MPYLEYWTKVDRGRVTTPASWRDQLRHGVELAFDKDACPIAARPCERIESMSPQSIFRKLDARGRLGLPPEFRKAAGFGDVVVLVGSGDYFEIWSQQGWEEEMVRAAATAARMGKAQGTSSQA